MNGMVNSKGIYKWRNGDYYEGGYLNGLRHGHGKYAKSNKEYFKGNGWKERGIRLGLLQHPKQLKGIWKNDIIRNE